MSGIPRPVLLCIMDGWGHRHVGLDNAILAARTPNFDRMSAKYPQGLLKTCGLDVGLPEGQMGNSEVGHMNIGAGRVVMQDLPRIDLAVANNQLGKLPQMQDYVAALKKSGGTSHILGLLSPGGVHAHQDHMVGLARTLNEAGLNVRIHAFLDGRDTPPRSAREFLEKFEADIVGLNHCQMATISGRYWGMDRDKNWERVAPAYHAMVDAVANHATTALDALTQAYAAGKSDEFVPAYVLGQYTGMKDGDGLIMANFRADRARQILTALVDPNFDGFNRRKVDFAARLGMVEYAQSLNPYLTALFAPIDLAETLGEVVSKAGKNQLRIAETEKYAHVTYFFNGGLEVVYPGEERILVPSPKVATYDLQPEMSAPEVTDRLIEAIQSNKFDLICCNYANGDMVGHTGVMSAAVQAVETLDQCLGRLEQAINAVGGVMMITADHGNAEQMVDDETGQEHTQHTLNPVPFLVVGAGMEDLSVADGRLADIAPTILGLMQLPQPALMDGKNLIQPGVPRHIVKPQHAA